MAIRDILMSAAGGTVAKTYVDDVFSTYLYTGNGATQTINNGIDLAGKGGLVWIKDRTAGNGHCLEDTERGFGIANPLLQTNDTGNYSRAFPGVTSSGFQLNFTDANSGQVNTNNGSYVSWSFRKAPKFFDIVTWTGTGANRTIAHNLGVAPGMIFVKRTSAAGDWEVYSNALANTQNMVLNTTAAAATNATMWNSTSATASVFSLGTNANVNASGATYVAYLFAHDASANGLIQCGSYTGTATSGNVVTLGWEPQYVLIKGATNTFDWYCMDSMRGMSVTDDAYLAPNTSAAESIFGGAALSPTATGFSVDSSGAGLNQSGATYIYMAIRRPNKPPTTGTQVYNAIARTGTGAAATVTGVGFAPDVIHSFRRAGTYDQVWFDRLRGAGQQLRSNASAAEATDATSVTGFDVMDGVRLGTDANGNQNASGISYINHFLKRSPGFFDEVCYPSTAPSNVISHNLTVIPEFIIVKPRTGVNPWYVWQPSTNISYGNLNNANAFTTGAGSYTANSTTFNTITTGADVVAYLFASLPGISKIGTYTGNGTSQTINCGFTGGARFILIKRTNAAGDWYVWDTARGIVTANDPHLSLNTTAAEASDDSIDPDSTGFIVNQLAATNINVTSASYIFLAIA